ncbi:ribosome assembly cofactor RimP [Mesoplasma lactucae]|uniref:Ribosome maturation factor RimP n=1 Tax=Mesoplasma lactucae ATCC 49193 TaxID=81460 RepID=A0A291IRN4_9MOLU|nr:ribosome assembly cofactor RimP [Mesoplasma lactucae]ATG97459.1 ribosome assembly cofactor RimP [Mesoplasma lactucae ATCC 49193]ATZ20086.1 ribosome maturation factor RimP [Mesoplasma lactucae ATCC 49193]MCL8216834.1 Ribosome maturation factor RimP [Mesoplasma lactucae ATCC 49193]
MIDIKQIEPEIKKAIQPSLDELNLNVYEINIVNDLEDNTLQILVEDKTDPQKPMDFDLIVGLTEKVSQALDGLNNLFPENYFLEVASAGIEKQIRSEAELQKAIGSYVHVEFNEPEKGIDSFDGEISSWNPETDEYEFNFFVKGAPKKRKAKFDDIRFIRYAVKF